MNKSDLRSTLLAARRDLTAADRVCASSRLRQIIFDCQSTLAGATIAAYVPIGVEPGNHELLELLAQVAARVLLPITTSRAEPLQWGAYDGAHNLVAGPLGLQQPRETTAELCEARWALVPALALAPDGRRLGRGAGHYDRALGVLPRYRRVGVVYDHEVRAGMPFKTHDLAVGWICTPSGIRRVDRSCGSGNAAGEVGVIGDA